MQDTVDLHIKIVDGVDFWPVLSVVRTAIDIQEIIGRQENAIELYGDAGSRVHGVRTDGIACRGICDEQVIRGVIEEVASVTWATNERAATSIT